MLEAEPRSRILGYIGPLPQAAEAVRCRIDVKYAPGLELEDPGSHHSVLSDFRDRLAEGDRADRLLGLALTRIRRAGLLKGRAARASSTISINCEYKNAMLRA